MFELKIETHFSAAHHLLNYNGACENQHGHNWKVEVFVTGTQLDSAGILVDFKVLKRAVNELLDTLDHKDLNTLEMFADKSPSSENISKYLYYELKKQFSDISKVSVWETENACASYFEE